MCHAFWANNGDVNFSGKYCHVEKGKIFTPFLAPDRSEPEIYVSGHSEQAQHLALTQASCYLRLIDTPEKLAPIVGRFRENGVEVCLRLCVICRPTMDEALAARRRCCRLKRSRSRSGRFLSSSDSQTLKDALAGGGQCGLDESKSVCGARAVLRFVGDHARGNACRISRERFMEYKEIGVTQFIIAGWPKLEEMMIFGREVLPLRA